MARVGEACRAMNTSRARTAQRKTGRALERTSAGEDERGRAEREVDKSGARWRTPSGVCRSSRAFEPSSAGERQKQSSTEGQSARGVVSQAPEKRIGLWGAGGHRSNRVLSAGTAKRQSRRRRNSGASEQSSTKQPRANGSLRLRAIAELTHTRKQTSKQATKGARKEAKK